MAFIGGGLHAANSTDILLVFVFVFAGFLSIFAWQNWQSYQASSPQ